MHFTPAGFPAGIPGIGLEIEGAVQQAPQFDLHSIASLDWIELLCYRGLPQAQAKSRACRVGTDYFWQMQPASRHAF